MSNKNVVMEYVVKPIFLFIIVFLAVTWFPRTEIILTNKLLISATVVAVFYLLDVFTSLLQKIRGFLCKLMCGCNPYDVKSDGEGEDDLAML